MASNTWFNHTIQRQTSPPNQQTASKKETPGFWLDITLEWKVERNILSKWDWETSRVSHSELTQKTQAKTNQRRQSRPLHFNLSRERKRRSKLINLEMIGRYHNKVSTCMQEKIIHCDQVDFIPEMQRLFNICKLINVIQHVNALKDLIISVERENSFDKI